MLTLFPVKVTAERFGGPEKFYRSLMKLGLIADECDVCHSHDLKVKFENKDAFPVRRVTTEANGARIFERAQSLRSTGSTTSPASSSSCTNLSKKSPSRPLSSGQAWPKGLCPRSKGTSAR